MDYYGLEHGEDQPREAHENGDAEQSHNRFKQAVDQALLLRGSRDFAEPRRPMSDSCGEVLGQRNAGRRKRLAEERAALRPLPAAAAGELQAGVACEWTREHDPRGPQHLFGSQPVDRREGRGAAVRGARRGLVRAGRVVERFPRLRGQGKHTINYRHVIDWLVRKPGAFENYRYREDLFPTSRFRMAYDALRETHAGAGLTGVSCRSLNWRHARASRRWTRRCGRCWTSDRPVTFAGGRGTGSNVVKTVPAGHRGARSRRDHVVEFR